ncbi:MAG: peptide ABC transporter substrate-binding protein [Alphaproteobacteria bacterium]|nr:peptide ABC transporter substrate-binding protein [Alphaproteobacteria bacterium]
MTTRLNRRDAMRTAAAAGVTWIALGKTEAKAQAGALRVRQPMDISGVDPAWYSSRADMNVLFATQTKLVEFQPTDVWESAPEAAVSIVQADDTHIEFTLKEGMMWNPAELGEITGDDVKFSFERVRDETVVSPFKDELYPIQSVEVKDRLSGVIVLTEPSASLWSYLPWSTASIVSRKAVEALPEKKFTTEPPCYSGAYTIASWTPKQELVLAANPNWHGPKPVYEEVRITPIEDDKTAESAFLAGDLDFLEISISSIPVFQATPPEGGRLVTRPNLGVRWMGMNTIAPPLDNPNVRRAIQLSLNVDEIVEAAYFGAAPRATGVIPPGLIGYREANKYGRDVEQAKALLAEAGFADGVDVTLSVENNTDMNTLAQLVQAHAAEAGIRVTINPMESGLFWIQGMESEGEYWKTLQLFIHNWGWAPDPSSATMWYTPEQVGVWNWERWNSPEYDAMHKAALKELDPTKRAALYTQMMDMMEESGAYVFLTPGVNPLLVRDGIQEAVSPDGRRHWFKMFKPTA